MNQYRFATLGIVATALFFAIQSASIAATRTVVFRNDADVPIEFSLRKTTAGTPDTQILEPGGRIAFDLDEGAEYDICATGQDSLNGTYGETRQTVADLLARGAEVGVDGTVRNGVRVNMFLKFPQTRRRLFRCRSYTHIVTLGPATPEYKQWFYYNTTPRDRYSKK